MKLVEEVKAAEVEARERAAAAYREVPARAQEPRKGDAARWREAMVALGKSQADLESDWAVLKRAAALEVEAQGLGEAETARIRTAEAVAAHAEESARIAAGRAEALAGLRLEAMRADVAVGRARSAAADLAALRQAHAALFGLPEPVPAERPAGTVGAAAIGSAISGPS